MHLFIRSLLLGTLAFSCALHAQEPASVSATPAIPIRPLRVPGVVSSAPILPTAFAPAAPQASPATQITPITPLPPTPPAAPTAPATPPGGAPASASPQFSIPEIQPPADASARALPAAAANELIPFIDFPNTDIRQVLEFYETLTGKKALYDNTVQGNIHVRVTKPVVRSEAVRILETVFALNNFTLIPGAGNIVKVINTSKNVRQFSIPIFSEAEQLPESNQVVTFLFKLDYADPAEVKTALDQVVAVTPSITSIVALPKSQAVLVTENSDLIRNIVPIVARLDCKPAEVVSEFFPLERADAKEVVEKLSKMFEKTPTTGGATTGAPQPPANTNPNGAPNTTAAPASSTVVTLSEDALIVGKIRIEADLRTNRIHVVTRPVNLPFLHTLIREIDSGMPLGIPHTRPLRYVLAGDVLDIVAGSVAEPGVKVEKIDTASHTGGSANPVSNSTSNLGTSGNGSYGNTRNSSSSSSGGSSSSGFNANQTLQADNAPEGRIIRNTKIIADNRINAIIVIGNDEMTRKVFKLLDQIDVRAPQVMLTAVIGELTLDADEEFGLDYLLHKGNLSSLVSGTSTTTTTTTSGTTLSSSLGLPTTVTGLDRLSGASLKNIASISSLSSGVSGIVGVSNSLDIIVNALESTGRYRVTSRPMIFTSNNRAAVIKSGEDVPVPSNINSSYTTSNSLVSNTNIEYKKVELNLSVLPLINSDGEVILQISQEANNVASYTNISGNSVPNITTRSINTTVSVANEATIVLGGLVTETKQNTESGIPILRKLPIVGSLFGTKKKTTKRTELIVIIKPTVTNGPVSAIKAGEKAMEKTHFPPDLDASLDPPAKKDGDKKESGKKEGDKKDGVKSFATPKPFLRKDGPQEE